MRCQLKPVADTGQLTKQQDKCQDKLSSNRSRHSRSIADAGVLPGVALAGLVIAVELDLQSRPAVLSHLRRETHEQPLKNQKLHVL